MQTLVLYYAENSIAKPELTRFKSDMANHGFNVVPLEFADASAQPRLEMYFDHSQVGAAGAVGSAVEGTEANQALSQTPA